MDSKDYLVELRESTGMTRKEFCEYFEIPYRTVQDWELGNRKMPDYLLRLMEYKIRMEQGIKAGKELENNK
ncbi:transcriptional regulator [Coprococcus sp. AF19-8AC]|jgi:putative transcriptional regulator|uniref:helix-turn-helix domain-containing protein n=1 Tax=Coprococcus sp. AF19-8AC TaxID=2293090 RepID=UPI000E72007C|nr:transcriptional regulator [Coprococcus sp. AF19-8AC]RJV46144.1 transcriptional regulator [Coprococcus sp. AF19-8AC]